jgi:ATP-dependent DNA ligase
MSNELPRLYKMGENGALIQWDIRVEEHNGNPYVVTRWGQEGGQLQQTGEVVTEGKNIGKKNETTPQQQAEAEAKSKWEKQQKSRKYTPDREAALAGGRSELVEGGIDPMLAFPIEKKPKALKFPCAVQRKYDGHRMLAHIKDGVCNLWSRTRKPILGVPHIQRALEKLFPTGEFWLDGEGYTMAVPFEQLTSFLRQEEPKEGHEVVEYHIYDTVREGVPYKHRLDLLHDWLDGASHPLVLAPTVIVQNEEEMNRCFENFLAAKYEGAMARNLDGFYVGKRTPDLLKLKKFQDAEFEVVRVESETRTHTNGDGEEVEMVYARFTCKLPGWAYDGHELYEFTTTLNGDQALQHRIIADPSKYVGKHLTVKFQDYTKDFKPRFPKALRFREDV